MARSYAVPEILSPLRVPDGTKGRARAFYQGTTLKESDVLRNALLAGLEAFELDGFRLVEVKELKQAAKRKSA